MWEIIVKKSEKKILRFKNLNENFFYKVWECINFQWCFIVEQSQISFDLEDLWSQSKLDCIFLIPANVWENVNLDVNVNIKSSESKVNVKIYSLANDWANVKISWNLNIKEWIRDVDSRLYEEALIVWNAEYVSFIPSLTVSSPEVVASHWAKIQRISEGKLFYMQSRGLDFDKSMKMIKESYYSAICDELEFNDNERSEFYSLLDWIND